jgi:hypothetical protein
MFYQLLFADMLRGSDATGVITVHSNGDFGIMKEASDSYYFNEQFKDSDLDKDLYKNGVAAIGHNRAKTIGANKDENAHPFSVDNTFAMVHNGTLRNHHELEKTEVDSEALAIEFKRAMDEDNWKGALEEVLGKVRGAFACVWYDQKRHQVCMIRNAERPLGYIETPTTILFGSELQLCSWIAGRNGQKTDKWKSLDVHKLYTFDMKKGGGAVEETFLSPKYPFQKTGYTNATTPATGETTTGNTETPFDRPPLSKNGFKKLRGEIFRKKLSFLVEDYVEGMAGNIMVMGISVDGAYDICEVRHRISGLVKPESGLKEEDFWVDSMIMEGVVADVEYDKEKHTACLIMENLTVKEYCVEKALH